jgi:hypothetical protein
MQGLGGGVGAVGDEDRRGIEGPPALGAVVISLVAFAYWRFCLQAPLREDQVSVLPSADVIPREWTAA